MLCSHLRWLELELTKAGHRETYRGQPWSNNCREWVYFDVVLDLPAIRAAYPVPAEVEDHENLDERSGVERGLVCAACHDGIVGAIRGTDRRFPA